MMAYHKWAVIGVVLICGLYACYTDIKYHKIYNSLTYPLICAGFLMQLTAVFFDGVSILTSLQNIGWPTLILGCLFWWYILGTGDVKFLLGITLLFPQEFFSLKPERQMPTPMLTLLVNIFVIYFLCMSIYICFRTTRKEKLEALRSCFRQEELPKYLAIPFAFGQLGYITSLVWDSIGIWQLGLLKLLLLFILYQGYLRLATKFNIRYPNLFLICICSAIMITHAVSWQALIKFTVLYGLAYFPLRIFWRAPTIKLGQLAGRKLMDVRELKEGMILDEFIVKKISKNGMQYAKQSKVPSKTTREREENLRYVTRKMIEQFHEHASKGLYRNFDNKIYVRSVIPFVPFIFAGLLITVLFQGVFYVPIVQYIFR